MTYAEPSMSKVVDLRDDCSEAYEVDMGDYVARIPEDRALKGVDLL